MRYMLLINSDKAAPPPQKAEMEDIMRGHQRFAEELQAAKKMVHGERLRPDAEASRIRLKAGQRQVTDGPFAETKELIAGFWLWNVKSMEEAVDWVKRCPNPHNEEGDIEIRQVFDFDEFAPCDPTGDLRAAEARMREQLERQQ